MDTKIKSSQGITTNTEKNQFSWTDKNKSLHSGIQMGHNKIAPAYIISSFDIWLSSVIVNCVTMLKSG